MTNDTKKLLERYKNGDTNISVEYCFHEDDGSVRWVQKTNPYDTDRGIR